MKWLLLTLSLATAVHCHILANGDNLEVHTVLGGAVTVKLEYPPVGLPIANCCFNTKILQQPVLAGAVVTEVADLKNLGYLLRLDFVENIVTCHLIPDDRETNDISSSLCPALSCPVGWNLLQDTCFLVTKVSGSWGEGQTFCQQQGGVLATISSNIQQLALSEMLTNDTWIGFRHRHDNPSYGWTDGSEHTYTNWAQKEPGISETPDGEECVEMSRAHNFLWNSAQCNQPKHYLCSVPGIMISTHVPECESSWSEYQLSCYKVFKEAITYTEATTNCRALGAYLASIGSEGENSFLTGLIEDESFIGLNDKEKEGVFTWQDGSPFSYSNWFPGEPDNYHGIEDCVQIRPNSIWHDLTCGSRRHYICEKSIQ